MNSRLAGLHSKFQDGPGYVKETPSQKKRKEKKMGEKGRDKGPIEKNVNESLPTNNLLCKTLCVWGGVWVCGCVCV